MGRFEDLAVKALLEHIEGGGRQHPAIEGLSPEKVNDLVGYCWQCGWIEAKDVTSHTTAIGRREYMIKRLTDAGRSRLTELRASR